MAIDVGELKALLDALLRARFAGVRTVEIDGRRVTYASDAEMERAIADLERRIASEEGRQARRAYAITEKGL